MSKLQIFKQVRGPCAFLYPKSDDQGFGFPFVPSTLILGGLGYVLVYGLRSG
jgi:hypothetical protein